PPGFEDAIAWLAPPEAGTSPHWHVTFSVADRDAAAATAQRLGASVLSTADTQWTRTALVRDPQGATFTASQFTPPEPASTRRFGERPGWGTTCGPAGVAKGWAEAITARYKKLYDLSALNEMIREKFGRGYHVRARRGG